MAEPPTGDSGLTGETIRQWLTSPVACRNDCLQVAGASGSSSALRRRGPRKRRELRAFTSRLTAPASFTGDLSTAGSWPRSASIGEHRGEAPRSPAREEMSPSCDGVVQERPSPSPRARQTDDAPANRCVARPLQAADAGTVRRLTTGAVKLGDQERSRADTDKSDGSADNSTPGAMNHDARAGSAAWIGAGQGCLVFPQGSPERREMHSGVKHSTQAIPALTRRYAGGSRGARTPDPLLVRQVL